MSNIYSNHFGMTAIFLFLPFSEICMHRFVGLMLWLTQIWHAVALWPRAVRAHADFYLVTSNIWRWANKAHAKTAQLVQCNESQACIFEPVHPHEASYKIYNEYKSPTLWYNKNCQRSCWSTTGMDAFRRYTDVLCQIKYTDVSSANVFVCWICCTMALTASWSIIFTYM